MVDNVSDEDLRSFFVSYWLLHSALYNFAQGLENQKNRRFTWAITSYYYSVIFVGRLLMFLTKNLYFTGHTDLANFFSGSQVRRKKAVKLQVNGDVQPINISGNCDQGDSITLGDIVGCTGWNEEKIKKFGNILRDLKNFRNKNTYESFIIYAQEKHSTLTDFMLSATDSVRSVTENYLKEGCKTFFNYWKGKSENIVKLLKHPWLMPTTLGMLEAHNLPHESVETIVKRAFFFENPEVYSSNDLTRVAQIVEDTMPKSVGKEQIWTTDDLNELERRFERVCNISKFGAKRKITDEVFQIFKDLIELKEGD